MYVIGLTGGIASGKSTVAEILKELGAVVIDTDQVAREVVVPGQPAYRDIADAFGREVFFPDGRLDRRTLGRIVFNDDDARQRLNRITHPRIREIVAGRLKDLYREDPEVVVVIEAPLLFEAGMEDMVDTVWLVEAPEELRLKRIMTRDNLSRQEALARLQAQSGGTFKFRGTGVVLKNDDDLDAIRRAVRAAWEGR